MSETYNSIPLTGLAASLAACMGIAPPHRAGQPIEPLFGLASRAFAGRPAGRVLLVHPDAVGLRLYQKHTLEFAPVLARTQLALPMRTAFPPKTPVCFATMFSGASPEEHGIRKYEKPVLAIDTLFDAVARAGKRAAIVAVQECSMSKIFLNRDIDYFILPNDDAVFEKAMKLIREDKHDFLSVYQIGYDSLMHNVDPECGPALDEMRKCIRNFARLADQAAKHWAAHDVLVGFAPDHGNHRCAEGNGEHGEDIPEDMNIMHFYGATSKTTG